MVRDPIDGRVRATLLPVASVGHHDINPHTSNDIKIGAAATSVGWFIATLEGYFDCSSNATRAIKWNVNGELYPAERYLRRFRRPDLVRKALRGGRITAPQISNSDIPPSASFAGIKDGDAVSGDTLAVTVAVYR